MRLIWFDGKFRKLTATNGTKGILFISAYFYFKKQKAPLSAFYPLYPIKPC
jgi:hypothetical protein